MLDSITLWLSRLGAPRPSAIRTVRVPAENRTARVLAENRTVRVWEA